MNWSPDESTGLAARGAGEATVVTASTKGSGMFRLAGDMWEDFEDEWTKSLQTPPEDPARATAREFLALAGSARVRLRFRRDAEEMPTGGPKALAERFGSAPVLVFQTSEWLLVGCFFKFSPWFNVQAVLLDAASGRVLWRNSCASGFPNGSWSAWPSELDADGRALYARVIHDRADQCSKDLFVDFARDGGSPPMAQMWTSPSPRHGS